MSFNTDNKKPAFSRYSEGYIAGYEGYDILMPEDHYYMLGYNEGKCDDLLGSPYKFFNDVVKVLELEKEEEIELYRIYGGD